MRCSESCSGEVPSTADKARSEVNAAVLSGGLGGGGAGAAVRG